MRTKKVKVVHRKLGRERADGLAFKDDFIIHIDSRLTGKNYVLTAIHELLHIYLPDLVEDKIIDISENLCDSLWDLKIRKIDE